ncbi:MAG: prepilin-type N-terminal cleavage/methylation domain-containing protein [Phycisphaerales bacterium]|nr:prepilin-type N-terminal cleavage/methylation domain-containing protein [Phycisphaerales bacterium]MCI0629546.1 prepilin-type N-terminal cleavage/methylation domain-containing protein [Phycisphaerales bacterium]
MKRAAEISTIGMTALGRRPHLGVNAHHRGFTLIETALATIIVGVGVLAMLSAQQAFHKQNAWSTHATIGARLGNEIREMTLSLPRHDPVTGAENWGVETENEIWVTDYDDLDDFDGFGDGSVFSADNDPINGPLNARREVIANMPGWTQIVTVHNVDPTNIDQDPPPADGSTNMVRVDVLITYQGPNDTEPSNVTTVSWIAPN